MNTLKKSDRQLSYKDLSISVLKGNFSKGFKNVVLSKPSKKDSSRFDPDLFNGKMSSTNKRRFKDPAPTYGNWDKFMLNNLRQEKNSSCIVIPKQKLIENSKTGRTILSWVDSEIRQKRESNKEINNKNKYLKSSATGSISNLLAATPLYEIPKKQLKKSASTDIFNLGAENIKGKKILSKNASFSNLSNMPKSEILTKKNSNISMNLSIARKEKLKSLNQSVEEIPISRIRLVKGGGASNEQSCSEISNDKSLKKKLYQNQSSILFF